MKKHKDLKTKFDTEWSDMMSSYLESLEKFEKNRKSPVDLLECNFSPIKPKVYYFSRFITSIINEDPGVFESKKFNITESQKEELFSLLRMNEIEFRRNFKYLFSGKGFEAWVANTREEFEDSGMSLEEFKNIIENDSIFTDIFLRETTDKQEMLLFSRLCYLTTMNSEDKSDDRWWFLLEALKENKDYKK